MKLTTTCSWVLRNKDTLATQERTHSTEKKCKTRIKIKTKMAAAAAASSSSIANNRLVRHRPRGIFKHNHQPIISVPLRRQQSSSTSLSVQLQPPKGRLDLIQLSFFLCRLSRMQYLCFGLNLQNLDLGFCGRGRRTRRAGWEVLQLFDS